MTDHSHLRSKLLDDLELRALETEARLEPNIAPANGESLAMTSIAISLKRIADVAERNDRATSYEDREAGVWLYMNRALTKRLGDSYIAYTKLMDYFKRRTE